MPKIILVEDCKMRFYDMPLSQLQVLEAGDSTALVIVPATISECKDWIPLTRFMAQWFHAFFFELPGTVTPRRSLHCSAPTGWQRQWNNS